MSEQQAELNLPCEISHLPLTKAAKKLLKEADPLIEFYTKNNKHSSALLFSKRAAESIERSVNQCRGKQKQDPRKIGDMTYRGFRLSSAS